MYDISDLVMDCYQFAKSTFWTFNLFGREWNMTFLQIWLIPCVAGLTIRIVKHIYEVVNM